VGFYTRAVRPALFALDAERAHELTLAFLQQPFVVHRLPASRSGPPDSRLRQRAFGLDFEHPIGLAAGLDKHGAVPRAWAAMGFAFAEIGTVTPRPQPGNPRPRLFRLPRDRAIINRFGFNSVGAPQVARNLADAVPPTLRVGINVGKNRDTENERAADDCVQAVEALHPFADYFVINVSSPNTAGLRDLQESRALRALVERVTTHVRAMTRQQNIPVLVKVSPDSRPDDLLASVDAALEGGASGIVATNTTIARDGLKTGPPLSAEAGGLSGAPLKTTANGVCQVLFRHLGRRVPIIGVGGVFSARDAYDRIRSGATLVQLYTALIYEGPGVVRRIVRGLSDQLQTDGFSSIEEAIGSDVR
jgi:dihydroorotate dehydrogenase